MYNEIKNRNIKGTLTQKFEIIFKSSFKRYFQKNNVKGTVTSELKKEL